MGELFRTNEHGLINVVGGSINMFMMRILVPDEYEEAARQLLIDAELSHWLRDQRHP